MQLFSFDSYLKNTKIAKSIFAVIILFGCWSEKDCKLCCTRCCYAVTQRFC